MFTGEILLNRHHINPFQDLQINFKNQYDSFEDASLDYLQVAALHKGQKSIWIRRGWTWTFSPPGPPTTERQQHNATQARQCRCLPGVWEIVPPYPLSHLFSSLHPLLPKGLDSAGMWQVWMFLQPNTKWHRMHQIQILKSKNGVLSLFFLSFNWASTNKVKVHILKG
jgi:hypothetical protein